MAIPPPRTAPPLISFLMAAYNAAPWIEAAIRSALAQAGCTVEVIVVDDASRDDTASRVAALAEDDPRIVLLRRSEGAGPAAARNVALAQARGDWVAILDADDLVEPERSRDLVALAQSSGCDMVADGLLRFSDENARAVSVQAPSCGKAAFLRVDLCEYLRRNRLTGGDDNLGYLKPVIRRAFLLGNGLSYDEQLRIGEDFNLCLRCLAAGTDLVILPRPLYRYRITPGSLSRRLVRQDVDAMLEAHDAAMSGIVVDAKTRVADAAYRRSIAELRSYVAFRTALSRRDWGAVVRAARQPGLWPGIAQLGSNAVRRRVSRLADVFTLERAALRRTAR